MLLTNTRCAQLAQTAHDARQRVDTGKGSQLDQDYVDLHDLLTEIHKDGSKELHEAVLRVIE